MAPAYQKTVPVEAGKLRPTPGPWFSWDELARRAVFPSWAQHELGAVENTLVLLTSGRGFRRAATEGLRVPAEARGLFPTSRVAALWQWMVCGGCLPKQSRAGLPTTRAPHTAGDWVLGGSSACRPPAGQWGQAGAL